MIYIWLKIYIRICNNVKIKLLLKKGYLFVYVILNSFFCSAIALLQQYTYLCIFFIELYIYVYIII